jgi:hypothetical protein
MRDGDPAQGGGQDIGQRAPETDPAIIEAAGRGRRYREAVGQRPNGVKTRRSARQSSSSPPKPSMTRKRAKPSRLASEDDQRQARLAPGIGGAGDQRLPMRREIWMAPRR